METGPEMNHDDCQQAGMAQDFAGTAAQGVVNSMPLKVVKKMQECRYQSSADSRSHSIVNDIGFAAGRFAGRLAGTVAGLESYMILPAVEFVDRADSCWIHQGHF